MSRPNRIADFVITGGYLVFANISDEWLPDRCHACSREKDHTGPHEFT